MRFILSSFLAVSMLVGLSTFVPVPVQAAGLTEAQIQAIVSLVTSFGADATTVKNVEASLRGQPTTGSANSVGNTGTAISSCIKLSFSLSLGVTDTQTNGEVTKLQQFLAQNPSIYPEGKVTGYFGPATMRAVQHWQAANGVVSSGDANSTGYGYVGTKTRAEMAKACSSTFNSSNGGSSY